VHRWPEPLEVNQTEHEICSYLESLLTVEATELEAFTQRVKKEYGPDPGFNPPQWVSTPTLVVIVATAPPITPIESVAPHQAVIDPGCVALRMSSTWDRGGVRV
jgi:hypothetical protein